MTKRDHLNPERTGKQLARIVLLVEEVSELYLDAIDGGSYPRSTSAGGRGTGFEDVNPTATAAMSPTQKQLRGKARHASGLIESAMEKLEDAAASLKDGFLLTDEDVLARHLEKRRAAIAGR